eukprot:1098361-Lingulodinium_polyedra.AAC.1
MSSWLVLRANPCLKNTYIGVNTASESPMLVARRGGLGGHAGLREAFPPERRHLRDRVRPPEARQWARPAGTAVAQGFRGVGIRVCARA